MPHFIELMPLFGLVVELYFTKGSFAANTDDPELCGLGAVHHKDHKAFHKAHKDALCTLWPPLASLVVKNTFTQLFLIQKPSEMTRVVLKTRDDSYLAYPEIGSLLFHNHHAQHVVFAALLDCHEIQTALQ